MIETKPPKLFISYSWTTPQHEDWVLNLATELRESGVDVILDKWDLREGDDANSFMERMVTDESVDKVLIVCDRKYVQKANSRQGGVGTETQIISAKVYESVKQSKFVVVVAERDEEGKIQLPVYYTSRIYIDLSDDDNYSKNFEQLLRWIYDKPLHVKPKLGKPPTFLGDSNPISLGTDVYFRRAIDAVKNGKSYADGAVTEYFQTYGENLENFRLKLEGNHQYFDDKIIESIEKFIPYRNQIIDIFIRLAQYTKTESIAYQIHKFFESLIPYMYPKEGCNSYRNWDFDNYKFIIEEIFLYCLAVFIKYERFNIVNILVNQDYYHEKLYQEFRDKMQNFCVFQNYLESLQYRNLNKSATKWCSLHANILKERCNGIAIRFEYIQEADFILFILNCKNAINQTQKTYQKWYPKTLIYDNCYHGGLEIFSKARSKKYFDQWKCIFNVDTKEELTPIFKAFNEKKLIVPQWGNCSFNPFYVANFDDLCTKP